jgi:hypothetical protein
VAKGNAAVTRLTAQAVLVERKCTAVKAAQAARPRTTMATPHMASEDNSGAAVTAAAAKRGNSPVQGAAVVVVGSMAVAAEARQHSGTPVAVVVAAGRHTSSRVRRCSKTSEGRRHRETARSFSLGRLEHRMKALVFSSALLKLLRA